MPNNNRIPHHPRGQHTRSNRVPHHPQLYDGQHTGSNENPKNRVVDTYKNMFVFGLARWAFSIAVLALCAMQFGDGSTLTYPPYVASLIYNVACVSDQSAATTSNPKGNADQRLGSRLRTFSYRVHR